MCAPVVMSSVHEGLSRRRFLGAAAGCAAAVATANAQPGPVRLPKGFQTIIDLTHPYSPALPVYPGYNPVRIRTGLYPGYTGNAGEYGCVRSMMVWNPFGRRTGPGCALAVATAAAHPAAAPKNLLRDRPSCTLDITTGAHMAAS